MRRGGGEGGGEGFCGQESPMEAEVSFRMLLGRNGWAGAGGSELEARRWALSYGQWESYKVSEQGRDVIRVGVVETGLTADRTDGQ